jgi:hypothetical protein
VLKGRWERVGDEVKVGKGRWERAGGEWKVGRADGIEKVGKGR